MYMIYAYHGFKIQYDVINVFDVSATYEHNYGCGRINLESTDAINKIQIKQNYADSMNYIESKSC